MSNSSEEENEVKEHGKLTALRVRRVRARRQQQYLNAKSFLKKTSDGFTERSEDEKSDISEDEIERNQLSSYEKEAEEFLEKAMNFEDNENEDAVLVLDGRKSDVIDNGDYNSNSLKKNENYSSEDDTSSIEKTKAELERYSLAFGEFLSQELEYDDIESEDDNSGFSVSEGVEPFQQRKEGSEGELKVDRKSFTRTKFGSQLVSHLNSVQKAIKSYQILNESYMFKELLNSYDLVRNIVEETEETLDYLERENSSLKSMLKFYENKYKASSEKYEAAPSDKKNIELELEVSRIETDEAKQMTSILERKLNSARRELSLKEQRITAQQDMYEFDAKEMRERMARLEQNLYFEKQRTNDLSTQLNNTRERNKIQE